VILSFAAVFAACDDSDDASPTPTTAASATPAATATPEPPPDLGSLIAPRGQVQEADPFDLAARYRI
jgi:hypothetical protein